MPLLNLSNTPHSNWPTEMISAASRKFHIVQDMPFPDLKYKPLQDLAKNVAKVISDTHHNSYHVFVDGDPELSFYIITELKNIGYKIAFPAICHQNPNSHSFNQGIHIPYVNPWIKAEDVSKRALEIADAISKLYSNTSKISLDADAEICYLVTVELNKMGYNVIFPSSGYNKPTKDDRIIQFRSY